MSMWVWFMFPSQYSRTLPYFNGFIMADCEPHWANSPKILFFTMFGKAKFESHGCEPPVHFLNIYVYINFLKICIWPRGVARAYWFCYFKESQFGSEMVFHLDTFVEYFSLSIFCLCCCIACCNCFRWCCTIFATNLLPTDFCSHLESLRKTFA